MSAVATMPKSSDAAAWTAEEKAVVEASGLVFKHSYGAREGQKELAPRPVVARFMHTCQRTGLDPLAKQIYCIGRLSGGTVEWSIQTAIDGFRVIAERSSKYAGQDAAEWLTESGEWVPVFVKALHGDHPLAARVNVYRHDWAPDKPAVGVATWDEYAQYTRKGDLTAMWKQRGPGQLAKCAEALAFRKAFPQDLSGMYTDDEMSARQDEAEVVDDSGTDWAALIEACETLNELEDVSARIREARAGSDELRVKRAARLGVLQAQEQNMVDAEEVDDDGQQPDPESGADANVPAGEPGTDGTEDQRSE